MIPDLRHLYFYFKRIAVNILRTIKGTAANGSIKDPVVYDNDKVLCKHNSPPVGRSRSIPEEPSSTLHYELDESLRQEAISTGQRLSTAQQPYTANPQRVSSLTEGSSTTLQQVYPASLSQVSNENAELLERIYGSTIPVSTKVSESYNNVLAKFTFEDEKVWFLKDPIDRKIVETMMIDKPVNKCRL